MLTSAEDRTEDKIFQCCHTFSCLLETTFRGFSTFENTWKCMFLQNWLKLVNRLSFHLLAMSTDHIRLWYNSASALALSSVYIEYLTSFFNHLDVK